MQNNVYIETYGCQMNVYDTELIKSILTKNNYTLTEKTQDAQFVMLNTCSIRDNADQRIYQRVNELKAHNKHIKIGILGCMATNFKTKLLESKKSKIDFIAGPDSYKQLPNLMNAISQTGEKSFDVTLSEFETYHDIDPIREGSVNAWIAIMRGCNNFCTFCVVPYTRGRERSRSPKNIVDEVKRVVDQGIQQVTLLGQNVNSYQSEKEDFTDLMEQVSNVPGIKRIRFTSPHPKDFPLKLLQLMAERDNICNQIHLPLQAGNNRILQKMNRTYTKEEFLQLVQIIKQTIPNIHLSTDIICGFCSETDQEFEDTIQVVKEVQFNHAFIFKYSERPNTRASQKFPDDVPEYIKSERITSLVNLQYDIAQERNNEKIGQTEEILIEQIGTKKDPNQIKGRNEGNTIVICPKLDHHKINTWTKVKIEKASKTVLFGQSI